ncbi:MAG: glycosyltransferase family 2 protein, partial [Saprospiraceae bacterium]|nr:glycosyltransferase family 2 protein [Saprospiraceae bacterium]
MDYDRALTFESASELLRLNSKGNFQNRLEFGLDRMGELLLFAKTIAVVVPCYNEEKQIGMVINGMPDFVDRIIVVNDCSVDRTSQLVLDQIGQGSKRRLPELQEVTDSIYNRAQVMIDEQDRQELSRFVDHVVVNGNSDDRIVLINHKKNSGVGAAIATGYKWCKDHQIDCTAVMAGDGQMDPAELASICLPVLEDGIDYVKGNRLIHRSAWLVIPKIRFLGNSILSILTKIASGYWHVSDTQTGYTAISLAALRSIRLYDIYQRYGMPNDM